MKDSRKNSAAVIKFDLNEFQKNSNDEPIQLRVTSNVSSLNNSRRIMNDSYRNFSEYQKRPTALKFGRGLHMRFGSGGGGLNQTLN